MEYPYCEAFERDGKPFLYIEMSGLTSSEEFRERIAAIEPIIATYPVGSLYTITNVEHVRFETEAKAMIALFMEHNQPYVRQAAVIGFDGVTKMMVTAILALSGRGQMHFAHSKEQAIEWLLKQ